MTATRCAVCSHERREEFDRALALKTITAAEVARQVGCNRSAVTRHAKNHLLPEVRATVAADPDLKHLDVVRELKDLYRRMKGHLERAEEADNWQAI